MLFRSRDIKPTNDTTGITTYFRNNLDTTNFISINTGSWTFTNYNGVAWVASPNESVNQARIWCKLIPAVRQTNNWRATMSFGPVVVARKTGASSQSVWGLGACTSTNGKWYVIGGYGNNSYSTFSVGPLEFATPTSSAAWSLGGANCGPWGAMELSTPITVRWTYTAATSNLAWSISHNGIGNIRFVSVGSSNNIAPLTAIGIVGNDQVSEAPQFPVRALTFEH